MWNRKELKEKAKKTIKKNYWTILIVCFILAICTGEFGMFTNSIERNFEPIDFRSMEDFKIISREPIDVTYIFSNENIEDLNLPIGASIKECINAVRSNINSVIKSQKYIYKIIDATRLICSNSIVAGIALLISAGIAFLFIVFISEPLIVGGRRFFIKIRKKSSTKVGTLASVYNKDEWGNIAKIMFLRNLYAFLWYLTIIGGFIKKYEYQMIPFLLAENPQLTTKEVFKLTKQMTHGNKWKMFILDLSFFPWYILSTLTLGIAGILYVIPYIVATKTELYLYLKKEAISKNYEYIEKVG